MAAYQPCFFAGVARTGVAVGTMVAIGSVPILAGLLAWIFRGERPTQRWTLATVIAISGCTLLVAAGSRVNVDPLGILLALGAGASYACYALASKDLVQDRAPDAAMAVVFCGGALLLAPLLFVVDLTWLAQPRGSAGCLASGRLGHRGGLCPLRTWVGLNSGCHGCHPLAGRTARRWRAGCARTGRATYWAGGQRDRAFAGWADYLVNGWKSSRLT